MSDFIHCSFMLIPYLKIINILKGTILYNNCKSILIQNVLCSLLIHCEKKKILGPNFVLHRNGFTSFEWHCSCYMNPSCPDSVSYIYFLGSFCTSYIWAAFLEGMFLSTLGQIVQFIQVIVVKARYTLELKLDGFKNTSKHYFFIGSNPSNEIKQNLLLITSYL